MAKIIAVRRIECPDCKNSNLEHVGVGLGDDNGIHMFGVCPDCRDVISVPMDKLMWSLYNGVTTKGN